MCHSRISQPSQPPNNHSHHLPQILQTPLLNTNGSRVTIVDSSRHREPPLEVLCHVHATVTSFSPFLLPIHHHIAINLPPTPRVHSSNHRAPYLTNTTPPHSLHPSKAPYRRSYTSNVTKHYQPSILSNFIRRSNHNFLLRHAINLHYHRGTHVATSLHIIGNL